MNSISDIIQKEFQNKKIVVVGDLVADQFLRGTINRVSREAPVFIMSHDETETRAGGAANAAVNVSSLDGNVFAVGLVGKDQNGKSLFKALEDSRVNCDYIVTDEQLQTTTKVRVSAAQHYAQRQQVVRIDYENEKAIGENTYDQLKHNVIAATEDADAIILSDYSYGVASRAMGELCIDISKEKRIPLLVDSRTRLRDFRGATSATPNQEELEHILGENFMEADCEQLRETLNLDALLLTRGNEGMLLLVKDQKPLNIDVVGSKEPIDVTGAGDTVIATYALGLASGLGFAKSAQLANHAGGIVVMKKGTASVTIEELLKSLQEDSTDYKTHTQ